jgi:nicotinamide-nucleotide amidase
MRVTTQTLTALSKKLGQHLLKQSERVVTAESCTGGFIAKVLTDIAGSSQWFEEGFVTYGNDAKRRRLGVARAVLELHGAVSAEVVRAMAEGALARTDAHWAIAVSGIAGPSGESPGKPVGTVWFAWARKRDGGRISVSDSRKRFRGNRAAVRRQAVELALRQLIRLVKR